MKMSALPKIKTYQLQHYHKNERGKWKGKKVRNLSAGPALKLVKEHFDE
jgi:hypothetical protein